MSDEDVTRYEIVVPNVVSCRTQPQRQYPPELKTVAVAKFLGGQSYSEIAAEIGVPRANVYRWVQNYEGVDSFGFRELLDRVKAALPGQYFNYAARLANEAMSPEKIEKASTLQLMTAAGIAIDKARLIEGHSTENVSVVYRKVTEHATQRSEAETDLDAAEARIARLEQELLGEGASSF